MSTQHPTTDDDTPTDENDAPADATVDRAELEVLHEENTRLRNEVRRARQTRYRRSALALAGVGVLGLVAAVVFSSIRDVLLVLGAIGVFAGIITYYLTPERVLTAAVPTRLTETLDAVEREIIGELGLREDTTIYLPSPTDDDTARLFVPQHREYTLPETVESVFLVDADERARGVALPATGGALLRDLTESLATPLSDTPTEAADQLADAAVEQFELADSIETDADTDTDRISFAVTDPALDSLTRRDHPIPSLLAVGLTTALDAPVELDVTQQPDARADVLVTCRLIDADYSSVSEA